MARKIVSSRSLLVICVILFGMTTFAIGQDDVNTSDPAGSTGDAAGNTSDPSGNTGDAAGNTSDPSGNTGGAAGNTSDPAGNTSDPAGNTSDPSGNTSDPSGNTGDAAGNTSDPAGNTSDPAGNTSDPAGNTGDAAGNTSDPSGNTSDAAGNTSDPAGNTGNASGNTSDPAGNTGDAAGQTSDPAGNTGNAAGNTSDPAELQSAGNTGNSENTGYIEENYDTGTNIEEIQDGQDPAPDLPYDGVQMTKDIAELKELVANLTNKLGKAAGDIGGLSDSYDSLNKQYNNLNGQYTEVNTNYNTVSDNYKKLKDEYDGLKENYKLLSDNLESLRGEVLDTKNCCSENAALKLRVSSLEEKSETQKDEIKTLTETEKSDIGRLEGLIKAAVETEEELKNTLLGPDTIITFYTERGGPMLTTVKSALSDLYNITVGDAKQLRSHQKQVSRISTALKAIDDLEAGLNKQKGITGQQQIQLKEKDVQLKDAVNKLQDKIDEVNRAITTNNSTYSSQFEEVTKKQESAVSRLQAQITSLTQFEKNVNNTMIGHDTIITIYTEADGLHTTTVKNALSDLYNKSTSENNFMKNLEKQISDIDLKPLDNKIDNVTITVSKQISSSISDFNESISHSLEGLASTETENVEKLQNQIDKLRELGEKLENRPSMGPDTPLTIRTELDENKLTTLSHALSDFYNGFAKESKRITDLDDKISAIDLSPLQKGIETLNGTIVSHQSSLDGLDEKITKTAKELESAGTQARQNLQAQIDVLVQNDTELAKRPELGPDTIITFYTQLGEKTTTIKTALADLYNISVVDSDSMKELQKQIDSKNLTSLQNEINDLNKIASDHNTSITDLSDDLTKNIDALAANLTIVKEDLKHEISGVLNKEISDINKINTDIGKLSGLLSNFGDNNMTINVQESDMIITLSAAVSQLYKIIDLEDKLIAELGSSLNSTSEELHGKIEGVSSEFNKLNDDLSGLTTAFKNQKPVTDNDAVTEIISKILDNQLTPIQKDIKEVMSDVKNQADSISALNETLISNATDISSKLTVEVQNLQSQIKLLTEMDATFAQNQTIASDKILSLITQDGEKVTTIKNSLESLYNISTKQDGQISQLQIDVKDMTTTTVPGMQNSINELNGKTSEQQMKIDGMQQSITDNVKNFDNQIQDLNTSLSDGDSGLQEQINELSKQQGQMSLDLKDIGSSPVISITSEDGKETVTNMNNALSSLTLYRLSLTQQLKDLEKNLASANVYQIDSDVTGLRGKLDEQKKLIDGLSLGVNQTSDEFKLKFIDIGKRLDGQGGKITELETTCGSCNEPKTDSAAVTSIADGVVASALENFQKSQIQPIQQNTNSQLLALNNTVTALLPPMQKRNFVPSTCQDLRTIGNRVNGIFPVFNTTSKTVGMTFCDFSDSKVSATNYGIVSVKQNMVNFYAQRNQSMSCCGNVTWQAVPVNKGRGFDMSTGVFTVPVPGYYLFNFVSSGGAAQKNRVRLQRNNGTVGNAWAQSIYGTMTITANLYLVKGDQVYLSLAEGGLYDNSNRLSHFTGALIDQLPITNF